MTTDGSAGGFEALVAGNDPLGALTEMLASTQETLSSESAEGAAGGGAVRIGMNGERRIVSVRIDPAVFETGDPSLLEELIIAAAEDAYGQTDAIKARAMSALGGLFGDVAAR